MERSGMNMLKVERVPIDSVRVYAKNAKLHPAEQIEQIKKSIQDFGNNDPIAVWGKDSTIVEGHGRYIALKELGYERHERGGVSYYKAVPVKAA